MNKIDKRFFYYKTKTAYLQDVDKIPENAIVFIEDDKCIITHNVEYKCSNSTDSFNFDELNEELKQYINTIIRQYIVENGIQEVLNNIDISKCISVTNGTLLFQNI